MLHGFLLLDKESGLNSFKLVLALRRLANQKRVGFAGTLDPLASGLMVMALGEYTKLLPYLEASDKIYQVEATLGQVSDTYDIDGTLELVSATDPVPGRQRIEDLLSAEFSGKIMQVPPRHSAIQIGGKRAYALARAGEQFELKARPVEIFSCRVLSYSYPLLTMEVHCSSGTYVRSLVHDLGQRLGCGAVVSALRRTAVGILRIDSEEMRDKIKKLEQLEAGELERDFVDPWLILAARPQCELSDDEYAVLARGNFVANRWKGERAGGGQAALVGGGLPGGSHTARAGAVPEVAIAFWQGRPVGVLADAGAGRNFNQSGDSKAGGSDFFAAEKLKFYRKLNIF